MIKVYIIYFNNDILTYESNSEIDVELDLTRYKNNKLVKTIFTENNGACQVFK